MNERVISPDVYHHQHGEVLVPCRERVCTTGRFWDISYPQVFRCGDSRRTQGDRRLASTGSQGMRRICAWCGSHLGDVDPGYIYEHPITHGICDCCGHKLLNQVSQPMQ